MAVAKEIGFIPNANARAIKAKYSHNLGILFYLRDKLDLCQFFFIQILNEFKRVSEEKGYDITILSKGNDASVQAFIKRCRVRQLDGVIIFGDYSSDLVQELINSDIPCVGFDYKGDQIPGVMSDNYEKTKELILKLIEFGHEKILFITGEDSFITRERRRGYTDAFRQVGKERLPCVRARYTDANLSAKLTKQLYPELKPTAIIYPDDFSATGGINALRQMNLSIPDDVSVASFDGSIFSEITNPPLTCICQDIEKIGAALAEKLIKMIEEGDESTDTVTVEAKIRLTDSCRKIN